MKKFVFLYYGMWTPTQEMKDAWGKWFASIADNLVDSGNPFGPGREISHTGIEALSQDQEAIVGYSIINAQSMEEAEKMAKDCPIITSVRVYEATSM
jgi:hypothetical protein